MWRILQYPVFLNFFGSVFFTTSLLGLYIRHFSSLAKFLTHVLKRDDTVLRGMPNLCARSVLVDPKRSFISVKRNSSFWEKARFGPIFFGDFLKFLPFLHVFLGPLQYVTFFIDPFTESNNLWKARFDGIPVSKFIVWLSFRSEDFNPLSCLATRTSSSFTFSLSSSIFSESSMIFLLCLACFLSKMCSCKTSNFHYFIPAIDITMVMNYG